MTKMITQAVGRASPERALRNVLRADGLLCAASGLVLLVGAQPMAALLGVGATPAVAAIGAGLLLYGGGLLWRGRSESVGVRPVVTAAVLNVAWVVASAAVLLGGVPALSSEGRWAVLVVADVVAMLAAVQFYLAWRATKD
jgi:hypothetical protein